jgi:hypothetical protein
VVGQVDDSVGGERAGIELPRRCGHVLAATDGDAGDVHAQRPAKRDRHGLRWCGVDRGQLDGQWERRRGERLLAGGGSRDVVGDGSLLRAWLCRDGVLLGESGIRLAVSSCVLPRALSGVRAAVLSGVLCRALPGVRAAVSSCVLSWALSGVGSAVLFGVLCRVLSGVGSAVLFGVLCRALFGVRAAVLFGVLSGALFEVLLAGRIADRAGVWCGDVCEVRAGFWSEALSGDRSLGWSGALRGALPEVLLGGWFAGWAGDLCEVWCGGVS